MTVIELQDGYNGHTALFNPEPIERDGNLLKLGAIGIGKGWLFRWVHIDEYLKTPLLNVTYDAERDKFVRL